MQVWNSSEWILNDGPQGLERLDFVIQTAAEHDVKVILAFTNNWWVEMLSKCILLISDGHESGLDME